MSIPEAESALGIESGGQGARGRHRARATVLVACGVLILAGGGFALYSALRVPEPPDFDREGLDAAIIAAVDQARAEVQEAPRSAPAWGKLGMVFITHDFRAQAKFCLEHAERLDPNEVRWPYFQALGALVFGEEEQALTKLERATTLSGDEYDAPRLRLAELHLSLNRLDEAESHLRELLKKNPRHAKAQLNLARVCSQRGDNHAALPPLSIAQTNSGTRKAATQLWAEIQQRLGRQSEADEARARAAAMPDDPYWPDPLNEEVIDLRTGKQAWLQLAGRYSVLGNGVKAIELLEITVRDYPNAGDAWHRLGTTRLKYNDARGAVQALRRACELVPQAHESAYYLGAALIVLGDRPEATACFRKAIALKPDYAPAHHNLGSALIEDGNPNAALEAFRDAVRFDPALAPARLKLAALLLERGAYAEAFVQARHALQLSPADDEARKLHERAARALWAPPIGP